MIRASDGVALGGLELALGDLPVEVGRDAGDDGRRRPLACATARSTSNPERAATSASPAPMIPEPTMPTVLMSPIGAQS